MRERFSELAPRDIKGVLIDLDGVVPEQIRLVGEEGGEDGEGSGVEWRTLTRQHLECGRFGLLHGAGQAYDCFADVPFAGNTSAKKAALLGRLLFACHKTQVALMERPAALHLLESVSE
jgi:hypothetical protein